MLGVGFFGPPVLNPRAADKNRNCLAPLSDVACLSERSLSQKTLQFFPPALIVPWKGLCKKSLRLVPPVLYGFRNGHSAGHRPAERPFRDGSGIRKGSETLAKNQMDAILKIVFAMPTQTAEAAYFCINNDCKKPRLTQPISLRTITINNSPICSKNSRKSYCLTTQGWWQFPKHSRMSRSWSSIGRDNATSVKIKSRK